jgi:hypothetical protein
MPGGGDVRGRTRLLLLSILVPVLLGAAQTGPTLTVDPASVRPGATVTLGGEGFGRCLLQIVGFARPRIQPSTPPARVRVTWDDGTELGGVDLQGESTFTVTVALPPDATPGRHRIEASCPQVPPPGTISASAEVTVLEPEPEPSPIPGTDSDPGIGVDPDAAAGTTTGVPVSSPGPPAQPPFSAGLMVSGLSVTAAAALLVLLVAAYRARRATPPARAIHAVPVRGSPRPARVRDLPGVAVRARVVARSAPRATCIDIDRRTP